MRAGIEGALGWGRECVGVWRGCRTGVGRSMLSDAVRLDSGPVSGTPTPQHAEPLRLWCSHLDSWMPGRRCAAHVCHEIDSHTHVYTPTHLRCLSPPQPCRAAPQGIATLALESPFYGQRKPPHQRGAKLLHVSDLLLLGRATIEEALLLLHVMGASGHERLGGCRLCGGKGGLSLLPLLLLLLPAHAAPFCGDFSWHL